MGRKAPRKRLTCRVTACPTGASHAPERLSALRPPLDWGERSKDANPGRKSAPRERAGLFDMVKNAATVLVLILRSAHARNVVQTRTCVRASRRPHPEEARSVVSKDEDGPVGCALMLRDASSALPRWQRLRSRCAAMLLSMRARIEQGAFAHPTASRTNLRLHEMIAGPASLFPACSLQGRLQPQRVTTWPPAQPPHTM